MLKPNASSHADFHNDLKYVELHGCVCSINIIELATHLLRKANSLKDLIVGDRAWSYRSIISWLSHDMSGYIKVQKLAPIMIFTISSL